MPNNGPIRDILIEEKIAEYHRILKEKGIRLKEGSKLSQRLSAYDPVGKPKSLFLLNSMIREARNFNDRDVKEINECLPDV